MAKYSKTKMKSKKGMTWMRIKSSTLIKRKTMKKTKIKERKREKKSKQQRKFNNYPEEEDNKY